MEARCEETNRTITHATSISPPKGFISLKTERTDVQIVIRQYTTSNARLCDLFQPFKGSVT